MNLQILKRFFRPGIRQLSLDSPYKGWISSKIDSRMAGHSSLLAPDPEIYELISVSVNPGDWDKYLSHSDRIFELIKKVDSSESEHLASWTSVIGGEHFNVLHLIKFRGGFHNVDESRLALKLSKEYQAELRSGLPFLKEQSNTIVKAFNFWPEPLNREGSNVYDVRSYIVKPGSMYDWANYWSKGMKCRMQVRPDIPYGGFFTQIGQLHTIHHLWCYKDLADRKSCRESTWNQPEWNSVVSNTVPLIKEMSTKILEPLPFSPTQ
ncbi:protein NipSnap [Lepeophtheirus salmonis]|uniref:Protein NipSnap n=1 Tax=Lepeophtheirus salmonis TaxID=72036 RepID=D3PIH5_LEPSM|nr:protein NipSnap-like [Lepeophtheirus salmonis]ADD38361.1 Protein NipSnap [Lepeophtheirus salmonis]